MYGGPWPEIITTLRLGNRRLAYCASSTPDISPPSSTSVTRARRSAPVEASTSSATSPLAHSTTSSPSLFRISARHSRWSGSSSTMRATKFDIIASRKNSKSRNSQWLHRRMQSPPEYGGQWFSVRAQLNFPAHRNSFGSAFAAETAKTLATSGADLKKEQGDERLKEGLAAGDGDGSAGYVARKWISQHDVSRGQLDRLARALHRNLFAEILYGILGQGRGNERCPDRSRGDRVGANAFFGQHLCQTRREIMNCALGRCIGQQRRVGCIRIDRGRIDNAAPRLHVADRSLGEIEHRVDVHLERQFPFLVADLVD